MFPRTADLPQSLRCRVRGILRARVRPALAWAFQAQAACILELDDLAAAAARFPAAVLPAEYTFRRADPADLPACALLAGAAPDDYQRRHRRGDQCYVTLCRERPVHLAWLHFGPCYVRGMGLLVEALSAECYLYNVFTAPPYRGKGLYKTGQQEIIGRLAAEGITRIRQLVTLDNAVPLATLPKLGYATTDLIRYRRLCGVHFTALRRADGKIVRRLTWRQPDAGLWI
jgi:GNAT superfamily N-acetyltransferase